MRIHRAALLFVLASVHTNAYTMDQTVPSEQVAMLALATKVNLYLPTWVPTEQVDRTVCAPLPSKWQGVTCAGGIGNLLYYECGVSSILLPDVPIPADISIFAGLGQLKFISELDLSNTGLQGTIPADGWSTLFSLTDISLAGNPGLIGTWPDILNHSQLPYLKSVDTTGTNITDSWKFLCDGVDANSYVTSACVGANAPGSKGSFSATITSQTTSSPCTTNSPAPGNYVASLCQPGSITVVGSDRVDMPCTLPQNGQYVVKPCSAGSSTVVGSDTVIAPCTSSVPPGSYLTNAVCTQGTIILSGSDVTLHSCTLPTPGSSYVSKVCVPGSISGKSVGSDTVITPCGTSRGANSYTSSICSAGTYNQVGTKYQWQPCTLPVNGQYVSAPCIKGDTQTIGSDTVLAQCSGPMTGYYVFATCIQGSAYVAGRNTEVAACGNTDGSQILTACSAGAYNMLGTPSQTKVVVSNSTGSSSFSTIEIVVITLGLCAIVGIGAAMWWRRNKKRNLIVISNAQNDVRPKPVIVSQRSEKSLRVAENQTPKSRTAGSVRARRRSQGSSPTRRTARSPAAAV